MGLIASATGAAVIWSRLRRLPGLARPWDAAAATGLAGGAISSVAVALGSRRIARDPSVEWMEVGMAGFGRRIIRGRPTMHGRAAGLAVHLVAEIAWALVFFGVLAPWTRRLKPRDLAAVSIPWAVLTTSLEYRLVLPLLQPWVRMQVPSWVAGLVRAASAAAYPLFYLFDSSATPAERSLAKRWARGLEASLLALAVIDAWARVWGEPTFQLRRPRRTGVEAEFIQKLTALHEIGLDLSERAARRAHDRRLRELGRLMALEHAAQLGLMGRWWRSWFGGPIPPVSDRGRMQIAGMPPSELLYELARTRGEPFDELCLTIMLRHREGVIAMCDRICASQRTIPQVALLARAMRHTQKGQREEMTGMLRDLADDDGAAVAWFR